MLYDADRIEEAASVENEEDLYAGIEYRQSQDAIQCLKIITRSASERISRFAFEYAVKNNRKKVTCMSKDNIMKMTDGLFHRCFNEVAKEYPKIENDHRVLSTCLVTRNQIQAAIFCQITAPHGW